MKESNVFFEKMDLWTKEKISYFFLIDYKSQKPLIYRLDELEEHNIKIHFPQKPYINSHKEEVTIYKHPISFESYKYQFEKAMGLMEQANVCLLNLTCETPLGLNVPLDSVFMQARAKYKIFYNNEFVCFSPETFVQIKENKIASFPMKGTIDASILNAEYLLLNNEKEIAEHKSTVSLLCDDLAAIADQIEVKRYRYIDHIKTKDKNLLQVSSEIEGQVKTAFEKRYGSLIKHLVPAGSITGTPKSEALQIIDKTEVHNRNYYSGVCGVFDGESLDSCVLIRYIEQRDGSFYYKSGGGITSQSKVENEYQEMIDKIYVPVD